MAEHAAGAAKRRRERRLTAEETAKAPSVAVPRADDRRDGTG